MTEKIFRVRLFVFLVTVMIMLCGCGAGTTNTANSKNSIIADAKTSEEMPSSTVAEEASEAEEAELADKYERTIPEPADSFAGGDGSEESPYQISNAEELYRFSYIMDASNFSLQDEEYGEVFRDKYYVITDDIVVNDVSDYEVWTESAPQNGWKPINTFEGHLDGGGHVITGLYSYSPTEANRVVNGGLIENLWTGASVENLTLEKCFIIVSSDGAYTGGIAGSTYNATVKNCHVTGTVLGGVSTGGIVGDTSDSQVYDCTFDGFVEGNLSGGGIAGNAYGSIIENCEVSGEINGKPAGGIAGGLSSRNSILEVSAEFEEIVKKGIGIKNCINNATVYSKEAEAGGIVGAAAEGLDGENRTEVLISECVNYGNVTSEGGSLTGNAGGICAYLTSSPQLIGENRIVGTWRILNCNNEGAVYTTEGGLGGILGYANTKGGLLEISGCSNNGEVSTDGWSALGGVVGGVACFEGVELRLESLENTANLKASADRTTGGIAGSLTVVESEENEAAFYIKNCRNTGDIEAEDYAIYGGIVGDFLPGIDADDFGGTFEMENCSCKDGVQTVGAYGSLLERYVKMIESIEE